jgi:hypothetical protein
MMAKMSLRFAWLSLIATLVLFQSCKKEDPEPATPADEVAGNYVGTKLKNANGEFNLPTQGVSTKLVATKKTDTTVDIDITITQNGQNQSTGAIEVELNRTSSGIDISDGTGKVGTYSNKTLVLNLEDATTTIVLTFAKQ